MFVAAFLYVSKSLRGKRITDLLAVFVAVLYTSKGWRRRGVAVLLGILSAAALPPLYIFPLLVPSFAGLFLLVYAAASRRQAFLDGWWWGLGYFTAGLYWICISLYVEPEKFAWLTPFALFGIPSVAAVYIGLVTLSLHSLCKKRDSKGEWQDTKIGINPLFSVLAFALLWVVAEYCRAYLLTGFPWNLIGYAWTFSTDTLQFASVVGVYGLSWLTVLVATMPVLFVLSKEQARYPNMANGILLLVIVIFGCWRLHHYPTQYTPTKIRIVQGNIAQSLKWDPKTELAGLKKYADLMHSPGLGAIQLVVWPETAIPYIVQPGSLLTHDLGAILPANTMLVSGGLRGQGDETHWQAWNSLFVINHMGDIVAQYDKHHLVPFGEFIPFRRILPLEHIAGGHGDFSHGPGPVTVLTGDVPPFSPLICYEAIFPNEATDNTHRAEWLLNITNDAWFGVSSGPYQHLQMARMRAVEQGLPLIRAANTGISAAFDPMGRMIDHLPLEKEGVLDLYLPKGTPQWAIFSRYPCSTILFIIALNVFFIILSYKTVRRASLSS